MTTTHRLIALPADEALATQVEQRLARHAEVLRPPPCCSASPRAMRP